MSEIRIYRTDEPEYKRLEAAAATITAFTGVEVRVQDIYYDFGSKWMYSALVVYPEGSMSYQLSDGRWYKAIVTGDIERFNEGVRELINTVGEE